MELTSLTKGNAVVLIVSSKNSQATDCYLVYQHCKPQSSEVVPEHIQLEAATSIKKPRKIPAAATE